ncbi:hypothetical protein H0I25_13930 [Cellulophaga sp. HaHa_2_95]|uniref:hypothetical protein n=1 Tax=Cellulophaga sp. HaHa_2_95 TaxID=2745558 RepID=UPI001C4FE783|nr:hypothetical protein [Cellulophaga sp. HaHa_2_95]QXP55171.1 hypothetical protein H0I25_13930 [Cellulophaga sp. HaHa_2_95]
MKNLLLLVVILLPAFVCSQSVDLETFGKSSPFKIGGGISASSVFYSSNQRNNRAPFTYFAQGNLNISYYNFSIPISYNYSNQGDQLGYQLPFNFNRLSLHPKYKWVTAHVGDVNMSFSPYTLSGHQFSGAGVEMQPTKAISFKAMYGRLIKGIAPPEDERTQASYQRMGYGFKTVYEQNAYTVGVSTFYAIDNQNSIAINPDEEGVFPKENLVLDVEGRVALSKDLELSATYATTILTQDLRAQETSESNKGVLRKLFNNRASTEYYNAYKLGVKYSVYEATLGIDYECVAPGYETLGAYFFNNDFENITLNLSRPLFNHKVNLSFNVGYQRDDLEDQKANPTSRFVGAINATYTPSERLSLTGSYSNFSTYTNVRSNQFEDINDANLLDNVVDTLNYKQVSQNANLNINYILSSTKTKNENLNLNYNVSDISNAQGGVVRVGDASVFHNFSTAYTYGIKELHLNITPALHGTYNTIGLEDAITWGPTISVKKGFFNNELKSVLSSSYNTAKNTSGAIKTTNLRGGVSYVYLEKHNLSLNAIQLFRSTPSVSGLKEFTATLAYNYSFDIKKPKINWKKKDRKRRAKDSILTLNYKKYKYVAYAETIADTILKLTKSTKFGTLPDDKSLELQGLAEVMVKAIGKREVVFKESAIAYLKSVDDFKKFQQQYTEYVLSAYTKLIKDAEAIDYQLEKEFLRLNAENNDTKIKKTAEFKANIKVVNDRFENHRTMLKGMRAWDIMKEINTTRLNRFKNKHINKVYLMYRNAKTDAEIIDFLEYYLADLYHKQMR